MDDNIHLVRNFAHNKHANQCRPNKKQEPKTVHISEVANYVKKAGGSYVAIAAAYLHDTVEDTDTTIEEIKQNFGGEVAKVVDELTDPPEFSSMELSIRKNKQAQRIIHAQFDTKLVKISDQLSNILSVYNDPPCDWDEKKCLHYVEGAKKIVDCCKGTNAYLEEEFYHAYVLCVAKYKH